MERRATSRAGFAAVLLAAAAARAAAAGGTPPASAPGLLREASLEQARCLRCHGMASLAALDEGTGRLVGYAVDPAAFRSGDHGRMACTGCHAPAAAAWPHEPALARERLRCLQCHKQERRFLERRFPEIGREVAASYHARTLGARWTCFACHDAHTFRVGAGGTAGANAVCLGCHLGPARFAALTRRPLPDLAAAHAWLPAPAVHARLVRCVDCHAAVDPPGLGHRILPKAQALRDCVSCHRRDSRLLATLYRHRVRESRARLGFVNATLLNDAYVIGATRNGVLDRLSGVAFAGVLLGLAAHGGLRWRRRRGKP